MKAISFIGVGNYEEVTYVWRTDEGEIAHRTSLFPEAVARIFGPDRVLVMVTPDAERHPNFQRLKERLGSLVEPVPIPIGTSERELWEIFDRCVSVVDKGDELLLDVTHAFRSLPLVVFTAASYLRRAKGASIRHIVYGAYDADPHGGAERGARRAPIFDLTPMVDLLDWLSGAELLLLRSDGFPLADKLEATQRRLWAQRLGDELPRQLLNVARRLRHLSRAMHLAWPRQVMADARKLLPVLDSAIEEVRRWSPPFAVIVEQVRQEVGPLAHDRPDDLDAEHLRRQLALIEHYLRKGLVMQAVAVAREWLVSWVVLQRAGGEAWLSRGEREEAEKALSAAVAYRAGRSSDVPDWARALPGWERAVDIWSDLRGLRNAVAHCAMTEGHPNAMTVESKAQSLPTQLASLLENVPDRVLHGRQRVIDLKGLYGEVAKLDELDAYVQQAVELAGEGNDVLLTGQAPVWLYLAVAHALHGRARRLVYSSPVTGEVVIFDHAAR